VTTEGFTPAWWLPGGHAQTLWPVVFRRRHPLTLRHERIETPDGDELELAHLPERRGPRVLVLHGLEGSLHSHYANGLLHALRQAGFNATFLFFRGCNGRPNRLPRAYHSGDTGDIRFVIETLRADGRAIDAAVGYSLGGNALLKYLGEEGHSAPLRAAAAVSVPYRLADAAQRLQHGFSRLYQAHLLASLRRAYKRKFTLMPSPLKVDVDRLKSFRAFDDQVTAPLHGFRGVEDYYQSASCRRYLPSISPPTLLLHARNDPFMYPDTAPTPGELAPDTRLELHTSGGHTGFVAGSPTRPGWYAEQRILRFLRESIGRDRYPDGCRPRAPRHGGTRRQRGGNGSIATRKNRDGIPGTRRPR